MAGRRIARSARGEMVDFDLLDIKNKINGQPKPLEVAMREKFIDGKANKKGGGVEQFKKEMAARKKAALDGSLIKEEKDEAINAAADDIKNEKDAPILDNVKEEAENSATEQKKKKINLKNV